MKIAIKFVKEDVWVGVFWRRDNDPRYAALEVYVCILPCLPIRLTFPRIFHPKEAD